MADCVVRVKCCCEFDVELLEALNQVWHFIGGALFVKTSEHSRVRWALEHIETSTQGDIDASDAAIGCVHGANEQQLQRQCERLRILQIQRLITILEQIHELAE